MMNDSMMELKYRMLVVWGLFFVVCSVGVFGFGIQPASTSAFFVPEAKGTYTFTIINSDAEDLVFTLKARGDVAGLVSFPQDEVFVRAGESAKVEFVMLFPNVLSPGVLEGSVVVGTQAVAGRQAGGLVVDDALAGQIAGGGFSAQLQLLHKVSVDVPSVGKYVVANLRLQDGQDVVDVVTEIQNKGFEKIDSLSSQVSVLEKGVVLDLLPANSGSLGVQDSVSFQDTLQKGSLDNGEYTVLAEILYDNARLELSKKLEVGLPSLVVRASDEFIAVGKVNKWDVEVVSLWNDVLKDQSFDVSIIKNDVSVEQFRTLSFDVEPGSKKTVRSYIDAGKLGLGDFVVEIKSEGAALVNGTRVLHVVREDELPGSSSWLGIIVILLCIVLVLLVLVVALFVLQKRKQV